MDAKEGIAEPYRMLATVGVFHLAFRKIGKLLQTPSPTYPRIWKTPLIADRVAGHDFPAFSKLRRSGWRQKVPHARKRRGFSPGNLRNREFPPDAWSDTFPDLGDAFDY